MPQPAAPRPPKVLPVHPPVQALLKVVQAFSRTLDLQEVLDLIVEKVLSVTGAVACGIARITPAGDLMPVRVVGILDAPNVPVSVLRGEGVAGRSLELDAPV